MCHSSNLNMKVIQVYKYEDDLINAVNIILFNISDFFLKIYFYI